MESSQFLQHLAAGRALMRAQNLTGAILRFKEALALSPNEPQALALIAGCQMDLGQLAEAKATAEAGLAVAPDYPPLHRTLGAITAVLKDAASAERHLRRAIELDPNDPMSHAVLCHHLTRAIRSAEAAKAIETALSLAPDDVRVLSFAVDAYLNQNRYDEAEGVARRAYALAPDDPSVLVANGFVELRRGRLDDAQSFATMAAIAAARTGPALSLLAQIQMARSSWTKPLWFAMNGMLSLTRDVRVVILMTLVFATVLAFGWLAEPADLIVGSAMLVATVAFTLCLPVGDAVLTRIIAGQSKAPRLKKEY